MLANIYLLAGFGFAMLGTLAACVAVRPEAPREPGRAPGRRQMGCEYRW